MWLNAIRQHAPLRRQAAQRRKGNGHPPRPRVEMRLAKSRTRFKSSGDSPTESGDAAGAPGGPSFF
eukprot:13939774-Alexandrium_andersonii.AAC.1